MRKQVMDRREFTLEAALAALSGVVITISGCGGSGYSSTPSSPSPSSGGGSGDEVGSVSNNHGHAATITGAALTAGDAIQLNIQGSSDHNHVISLSAAAIADVKGGKAVATDSTDTAGHNHTVTFNADAPGSPIRY
jgi:hypothetical protein